MIDELETSLTGLVCNVAQQVTRDMTSEIEAWQQEAQVWDNTQEDAQHRLHCIKRVGVNDSLGK